MDELGWLLAEAETRPVTGWDFTWLGHRMTLDPLPWDYTRMVLDAAHGCRTLLDMGTGGGEWLAELAPRPPVTVATESWPPNVSVAAARLHPFRIWVVETEAAAENGTQVAGDDRGRLPFRANAFELIANRHESFLASEVARTLKSGGCFVTQQAGTGDDIYRLLQTAKPTSAQPEITLPLALRQVRSAGLEIVESGVGDQVLRFADVGALAWYLEAIPWIVPGYSIPSFRSRFEQIHRDSDGRPLIVHEPRFWLKAIKPAG